MFTDGSSQTEEAHFAELVQTTAESEEKAPEKPEEIQLDLVGTCFNILFR